MAPAVPRLRILSVGGNAVSAFLSWRLQATNACDVTLVWKSGFDSVAQYGISFKSALYGNERFKPYSVVRTPEDAAHSSKQPFDYVLLCVKALPDVYDIANIIESVVSPQHTCILMNTTHSLGVESYLEQRFPTNVVLSLVSGAEIAQLGASEFEHKGATDIWVGPANKNPSIPAQIQSDMAEALSMTLSSGQVDCRVSLNIRQQQYERMIGPIAFQPASVLFETPNHAELVEKVGVRALVTGVLDELLALATAQDCVFPANFRETTFNQMIQPQANNSTMWMDFEAKRPMEIETYLGSPLKLAQDANVPLPRIETLYATLHHINIVNRTRPTAASTPVPTNGAHLPPPPPRMSSAPLPRPGVPGGPMMNGNGPMKGGPRAGSRAPSMNGAPPMIRRGPPPGQMNGGYPPRAMNNGPNGRRPSFDDNNLEEFSHLMLYDNLVDEGGAPGGYDAGGASPNDLALRERELMLRQKELHIREQELNMRRGQRPPPPRAPASHVGGFDDDDDEDDFFDPMAARAPAPLVDPDNFDMMSVTSRRNRKIPSASQIRKNPEMGGMGGNGGPQQGRSRNPFARPGMNKNRTSARMMQDVPGLHDSLMNNPLMAYSSNRYGDVDRGTMGAQSRANSLTAARLDELQQGGSYSAYPPLNPPTNRRTSQSPGNPLSPGPRPVGRPSPPNGYAPNGMQPNGGRPSPPGMRQPVPRHPPGHGNAIAPQQVEQYAGVSTLYPPKSRPEVRSLTGSASASDGSDKLQLDSENSAHSSQSSLGPRPPLGVR
ncbi:ketopantoate reductase PanE/ApbA-domain-containing protein [Massariosphaeria phaeospora]|uniref:Ketopantoate reductase PanE/ApbA-domain-containing protein n=1 Tax=Massariosphaeria phaeospora TaxID=100035 RepID=A0A7C8MAM8_9PLEO|nr:ketopantoate reductase PanE/ApbA-domain-containing protein [Massariosphaeria phaeospora]